jgi:hypothetical protein
MKKLFFTIVLCSLLLVSHVAEGSAEKEEDGGFGILYGDDHAFFVNAPEGWVLDNTSGVSQGLHAVFYPKGESWEKAVAVMYVNTAKRGESETVFTLIEGDTARFRQNNPDVRVEKEPPIAMSKGGKAEVRYFTGDQWGNSEAIAYIEEETIFVLIVLTSRTKEAFESAKLAFGDLVRSYSFWTTDVTIEANEPPPHTEK